MAGGYNPHLHHRHSTRLAGYDYRRDGAYFITVCAFRRRCVFGRVDDGVMRLNQYGQIVYDEWLRSAAVRPHIVLDVFQVMPNHFYAIVFIMRGEPSERTPEERTHSGASLRRTPRSLSSLMGQFKAEVTKRINARRAMIHNASPAHAWQPRFYDRIIRDEKELGDTRRYILENPFRWADDENHPQYTPVSM